MPHVSVTIDGKTYRMACDDGQEEHLVGLGDKLDETIQALKEGFGDIGEQRLAIMAGIIMADRLSESERMVRGLQGEIADLRESRNGLQDRQRQTEDAIAAALSNVAGRVTDLARKLNDAENDVRISKAAAE